MKLRYNDYRLPSESEPQQALMLTWPHQNTDWKDYLDEITAVYIAMADAITKQEDLWIHASKADCRPVTRAALNHGTMPASALFRYGDERHLGTRSCCANAKMRRRI